MHIILAAPLLGFDSVSLLISSAVREEKGHREETELRIPYHLYVNGEETGASRGETENICFLLLSCTSQSPVDRAPLSFLQN